MDDPAFAKRAFELDGGVLVVRIYAPAKAPGEAFRCRYSIGWPDREAWRDAAGLDGVQALMLAMRSVHTELVEHDACKTGRLTWCDQADLDLPSP